MTLLLVAAGGALAFALRILTGHNRRSKRGEDLFFADDETYEWRNGPHGIVPGHEASDTVNSPARSRGVASSPVLNAHGFTEPGPADVGGYHVQADGAFTEPATAEQPGEPPSLASPEGRRLAASVRKVQEWDDHYREGCPDWSAGEGSRGGSGGSGGGSSGDDERTRPVTSSPSSTSSFRRRREQALTSGGGADSSSTTEPEGPPGRPSLHQGGATATAPQHQTQPGAKVADLHQKDDPTASGTAVLPKAISAAFSVAKQSSGTGGAGRLDVDSGSGRSSGADASLEKYTSNGTLSSSSPTTSLQSIEAQTEAARSETAAAVTASKKPDSCLAPATALEKVAAAIAAAGKAAKAAAAVAAGSSAVVARAAVESKHAGARAAVAAAAVVPAAAAKPPSSSGPLRPGAAADSDDEGLRTSDEEGPLGLPRSRRRSRAPQPLPPTILETRAPDPKSLLAIQQQVEALRLQHLQRQAQSLLSASATSRGAPLPSSGGAATSPAISPGAVAGAGHTASALPQSGGQARDGSGGAFPQAQAQPLPNGLHQQPLQQQSLLLQQHQIRTPSGLLLSPQPSLAATLGSSRQPSLQASPASSAVATAALAQSGSTNGSPAQLHWPGAPAAAAPTAATASSTYQSGPHLLLTQQQAALDDSMQLLHRHEAVAQQLAAAAAAVPKHHHHHHHHHHHAHQPGQNGGHQEQIPAPPPSGVPRSSTHAGSAAFLPVSPNLPEHLQPHHRHHHHHNQPHIPAFHGNGDMGGGGGIGGLATPPSSFPAASLPRNLASHLPLPAVDSEQRTRAWLDTNVPGVSSSAPTTGAPPRALPGVGLSANAPSTAGNATAPRPASTLNPQLQLLLQQQQQSQQLLHLQRQSQQLQLLQQQLGQLAQPATAPTAAVAATVATVPLQPSASMRLASPLQPSPSLRQASPLQPSPSLRQPSQPSPPLQHNLSITSRRSAAPSSHGSQQHTSGQSNTQRRHSCGSQREASGSRHETGSRHGSCARSRSRRGSGRAGSTRGARHESSRQQQRELAELHAKMANQPPPSPLALYGARLLHQAGEQPAAAPRMPSGRAFFVPLKLELRMELSEQMGSAQSDSPAVGTSTFGTGHHYHHHSH